MLNNVVTNTVSMRLFWSDQPGNERAASVYSQERIVQLK